MSVKIRLKRTGRSHINAFRICVMDTRAPRQGREIEVIGSYAPMAPDPAAQLAVKNDRAAYWLSVGAQPSVTVRSLLKRAGVVIPVRQRKSKKRPPPAESGQAPPAPASPEA